MKVWAQDFRLPTYKGTGFRFEGASLGRILSDLFSYLFPLAGLLCLAMIIWGGFHLMISAGNPEGIKEGTNKIVYGIVGFVVIFVAYWLGKIIGMVFGIPVW